MLVQPIEALVPEEAKACRPTSGLVQERRVEPAGPSLCLLRFDRLSYHILPMG
jgi:hypothetical protein